MPHKYAEYVMASLVRYYASNPARLGAAAAKLASFVQLSERQAQSVKTLSMRGLEVFAVRSAMSMWNNWATVLPGNASSGLLEKLYGWLARRLPRDSPLLHCVIVEAVRKVRLQCCAMPCKCSVLVWKCVLTSLWPTFPHSQAIHTIFRDTAHTTLLPLIRSSLIEAIMQRYLQMRLSAGAADCCSDTATVADPLEAAAASLGGIASAASASGGSPLATLAPLSDETVSSAVAFDKVA